MYKKTLTTTLFLLVFLCGAYVARAQTYGRCDAVNEYIYNYAVAGANAQLKEEIFSLAVGRNVTIQYGFDSEMEAKGGATVCLYNAGGGLTAFGCESGLDGSGSMVLFLPAGSYRMTAGAVSVNPHGEGNDMVSGWLLITADKITPTPFNVTGGGSGCDGGNATFPIGLDNSEAGVTYQLSRGNVPVATVTSGGGAFSFGNFQTSGTYTVATVSPCVAVAMYGYAVITDPRPSGFAAWNDGPKCGTNPAPLVTLNATSIPGATYTWIGPYGATQTSQVGNTTVNGLVGKFDYSVYANINGCITSTAVTSVELFPAPPSVFPGDPQNVCGLATNLNASPPGAGFSARWEQKSGPSQTTFVDANVRTTAVIVGTPGTYVYKWIVSGASVCAPSINEVTVTFNIDATVRPVSVGNNGQRCSSDSPLTISLSGSQPGVNYSLMLNQSVTGAVLTGNGGALTWQDQGAGNYKIKASGNLVCERTWDVGTISVTETPALRTVGGSATVCAGTPVSVTLANPESSVTYQLLNNGNAVGVTSTINGNTLSWAVQTSGSYTVRATRGACTRLMGGTATITVNPVPAEYDVSGGGTQCFGGAGLPITLTGSQVNVKYQLKVNGQDTGILKDGNGGVLTWTNQTTNGTYTVLATHTTGNCTKLMKNSGNITINPRPAVYAVSGSATVCAGTPVSVNLSGSEPSVTYELLNNGSATGVGDKTGNGSALNWPVLNTGNYKYTVRATLGTCTRMMTDSAVITVNPTPVLYAVGGGGTQCSGGAGFPVTLGDSEVGVKYQLIVNGQDAGTPKNGTDGSLTWAGQQTSGVYTVMAKHDNGGCTQLMTGSGNITINPLPTVYTVSGGGTVCSGTPFAITLSNSQAGVAYQLRRGSTNIDEAQKASGVPISWAGQIIGGVFSITATDTVTQCSRSMGTTTVMLSASPTKFSISGGGERCDDKPGLTVSINGSQAGNLVKYQLMRDGNTVGQPVPGTGNAMNWGGLTESGTYTVRAIHNTSGCVTTIDRQPAVTINTKAAPTLADAGPDMNVCGLWDTLQANIPTVGKGHWEQVSGHVLSQFGDSLSHITPVSVSLPNTYVYAWIIVNDNGCVSTDNVSVIYNAVPTEADAGEDAERTICDDIVVELGANVAGTGNGEWTISGPEGAVFVPDVNTPNAYLVVAEPGTYICRWTITNEPCPASKDSVLVNFGVSNDPFTVTQSLNGSEKQYLIAEAQADATWRSAHTYQWLYTNSSNVQADVTNTVNGWQTWVSMFPDFLAGNVTDATLQVDVYSYGCLSRQVFGKDIGGGTLRKQEMPAMPEETQRPVDEEIQIYPVPATESLTVQIPFDGTWKAELRSMNGTLIQTVNANDRTSTLDVSAVPAGLYVLYIESNGKRVVRKVEVMR